MPELLTEGRNRHFLSDSVIQPSEEDEPDQRLAFNLLLGVKNSLIERFKLVTTIVTTITSTATSFTTVSTKTFFVQLCTPSPFPFSICGGKKKRSDFEAQ